MSKDYRALSEVSGVLSYVQMLACLLFVAGAAAGGGKGILPLVLGAVGLFLGAAVPNIVLVGRIFFGCPKSRRRYFWMAFVLLMLAVAAALLTPIVLYI